MRGQRFAHLLAGSSPTLTASTPTAIVGAPTYVYVPGGSGGALRPVSRTLATVVLVGGALAIGYALRGNSKTARAVRGDARRARTVARRQYHQLVDKVR